MDIDEAIRRFMDHRRRRRVAGSTLELYGRQLADWVRWRANAGLQTALESVSIDDLRAFFGYLDDRSLAPRTMHSYYRTLRALWRFLQFEETDQGESVLTLPQYRFFANNRIPLPEILQREQPAISDEMYKSLLFMAQSNTDPEEALRNEAILRLLWESGMRVHELAALSHEHVNFQLRRATIIGKGGKQGLVFWGAAASSALLRYVAVRRGPDTGTLLRGVSSRNDGGPVTPNLIRCMIKRLARRAGVALPTGSPCHSFRRAFARRARMAGASLEEVGELLRDETPSVIKAYVGLDAEPRQRLYSRIFE